MLITQYTSLLLQSSKNKSSYLGGDAFLEPYMQGLPPDFTSHHRQPSPEFGSHRQSSPGTPKDAIDDVIGGQRGGGDVIGASTNHNANNIADLAQFRLLDIDGSADSLDQDLHSDLSSDASSDAGDSGSDAPCDIGLVERLIRSHPVWFLPGIQRAGAFHLLQGKEEGNFVVRQSSQPDTMAISVRLPMGKGPYIEHYLIQSSSGQLSLESSDNRFDSIPDLIAHYSQCCDELPVQLVLPRAMREAKNRQQLSSLALLGQEFWRYPMANPRQPDRQTETPSNHQRGFGDGHQSPPSSGSSLSSFGSGNNNQSAGSRNRTPTAEQGVDPIVLNLAPLCAEQQHNTMTTFKGCSPVELSSPASPTSSLCGAGGFVITTTSATHITTSQISRTRPTPPNTLSLACSASPTPGTGLRSSSNSPAQLLSPSLVNGESRVVATPGGKTPPPPPPRWAKPNALTSHTPGGGGGVSTPGQQQNIVVTTTVTFNVNHPATPPPLVEVSYVQAASGAAKRPQIEMEGTSSVSSTEQRPTRMQQVMSPTTPAGTPPGDAKNGRTKKHRPSHHARQPSVKESHHYRESDILESPTTYCRSSVADKISDYEDVWGPEMMTSFKPPPPRSSPFSSPEDTSGASSYGFKKAPDVLERVGTPVSESCLSLNSAKETQRNRLGLVINTASPTVSSPLSPLAAEHLEPSSTPPPAKQGSPFYAEPADALRQAALVPRRRPQLAGGGGVCGGRNRHSDPTLVWPPSHHAAAGAGGGGLQRIDSSDELHAAQGFSSSVDNLQALRNSRNGGRPKGKPVQPPKIRVGHLGGKSFADASWAVDSSWEFIGKEGEDDEDDEEYDEYRDERERRFPSLEQQDATLEDAHSQGVQKITVQELISQRFPALRLSPEIVSSSLHPHYPTSHHHEGGGGGFNSATVSSRMSSYDNVEGRPHHTNNNNNGHRTSQISDSDTATIFAEPWDSSKWENMLGAENGSSGSVVQVAGGRPLLDDSEDETRCETTGHRSNGHVARAKSFKERLDPLLSPPRLQALRNRDHGGTGASIRAYALHLGGDKSTTFAQNIDHFIACTRDSRETSPQIVMRNMRQFMSGMKNYLVKHGEREFEKEVEKERTKLRATEFLNLDAILESVMHKLVVRPLKEHLYRLFVDEYTRSGAIQLLADNIEYARTKTLLDLGIRAKIVPPSDEALEDICHYLTNLQVVDSPLEKLENLLTCISHIFNSVKSSNSHRGCIALGADDFLPLFVWVLTQSNMVAAEIEAEYMWGLLHPSLLSGEGGYYLTTLSSAVHVLKNFRACSEEQSRSLAAGGSLDWQSDSLTEFRSVLKIVVPDEMHGSIITKTLPVRPNMTTRDVCKIIAHKVRITNPQDYGLFKLVDGEETLLSDGECPQDVKGNVTQVGKHVMFAYKRIDAKIAWPRTSSPQ